MPRKLREECAADPFYKTCARNAALQDHVCGSDPLTGRMIEWEHALITAGIQVQKRFAIIPLCYWAHRGPGLNKSINVWIALNRATDEELLDISKASDHFIFRYALNNRFGVYNPTGLSRLKSNSVGIRYELLGENFGVNKD